MPNPNNPFGPSGIQFGSTGAFQHDGRGIQPIAASIITGPNQPPDPNPYLQYALRFLGQLGDAANNLSPPEIGVGFVPVPEQPTFLSTEVPDLDNITWTLPSMPTEFTGQLNIENLLPEPFDAEPPQLMFGNAPEAEFGPMPSAPGVDTNFELPDLSLSLPVPPEMISLRVEQFDGVNLPVFDEDAPELELVAPQVREYVPGAGYTSSLLDAIRQELEHRIVNGGTGLNGDIEQALWDRARERDNITLRDELDRLDRMEGMGFSLPSGVWVDARLKLQNEHAARVTGTSREIMIKQAELELEGVRQALDLANSLEAKQMDIANAIEQRAFEATRYATEAGIAIYTARVQAFGQMVDLYRSKVQAYEVRLRGELARVEVYKAQLEAEQTKAQINRLEVEKFRVLTDAALSAVEVYRAQIQGIQARAEMERLKVQIFGEQVRAYGTQVNAFTATVDAFRTGVQAETAKQEAFSAAVRAYGAQVQAGSTAINARVAEFQARLSAKETEWRGFGLRASAEADRVRALAARNEAVARMYSAEAGATSSFNEVLGRQWTATTQAAVNTTNVSLEQAKANAQLYMLQQSMVMDAAKVGATVAAQMGSAALSANNFSTSFSNSRSVGASASYSYSAAASRSVSDSYSRVESLSA